jgi:hypothetical protein
MKESGTPGNANLPIGVLNEERAGQETGDPRTGEL